MMTWEGWWKLLWNEMKRQTADTRQQTPGTRRETQEQKLCRQCRLFSRTSRMSEGCIGLSNSLSYILCLLSCVLFYSNVPAQVNPVQDSLYRDSLNKAYFNQVKQNAAATGQDTTQYVGAEEEANAPPDTSKHKEDSAMLAKRRLRHSPKKAGWYSAVLPGLGQAYNKKYWKIPIIYAGFAGIGYAIYYTSTNFYGYRGAYRAQLRNVDASYNGVTDEATLKEYRDYFKSDYDVSIIVAGVWYALNIIDAVVDAHLFDWNMKNDISVSWQPGPINNSLASNGTAFGASVRIGF